MKGSGRAGRVLRAAGLLASAVTLASCSGTSKDIANMTCPRVVEAPATDVIAMFGSNGHDAKDVVVAGRIVGVDVQCQRDKTGVAAKTTIHFYAERANGSIPDAALPYFVAVLDPQQNVLQQQGFEADFKFFPGEGYRRLPAENITVDLPVKDTSTASAYTIVVGFQLTPEQLAFNRAHLAANP